MNNLNPASELQKYDTTINVIGSIKDCDPIFKTIESYFDVESASDNEFDLRTEQSRSRIERGVEVLRTRTRIYKYSDKAASKW